MAPRAPSNDILKVYQQLPREVQREFIEQHLAELFSKLSPEQSKKVKSSVEEAKTRFDAAPKLDLKGKQKQLDTLFDMLLKEAKLSMFSDRNNRDQVLEEIIGSLTDWFNDIWSLVAEHRTQFQRAHMALFFVGESLKQLEDGPGNTCRCDFINLPVQITLKDKTGKVIKDLRARGAQNIESVVFWIWRDLFLNLLAYGSEAGKLLIPEMLEEIEGIFGFQSMEKLVFGGKKTEEDGEEEEEEEDFQHDDLYVDEDIYEEDDTYESDDSYNFFPFHAKHWSGKFVEESRQLRKSVEEHLFRLFTDVPCVGLYESILNITYNPTGSKLRASAILSEVAGSTSETLVAALGIAMTNCDTKRLLSLLDDYSHLLRPRDAPVLQGVAAALTHHPAYHVRALSILETELEDTLQAIYRAARSSFARFGDIGNLKTLEEIIKLRMGSSVRQERIETWTESVLTSPTGNLTNMAFAAMMIGFPVPGMGDDAEDNGDPLNMIDLEDGNDPDFDDIREEFRPNLKNRLEGWTTLGSIMKGGPPALVKFYAKVIELMPFMKATDVVSEMANRLVDRPSKIYVSDALQTLSLFCKSQRKKINATRKESRAEKASTRVIQAAVDAADARAAADAQARAGAGSVSMQTAGSAAASSETAAALEFLMASTSGSASGGGSGASQSTSVTTPGPSSSGVASGPSAPVSGSMDTEASAMNARMRLLGQAAASADISAAFNFLRAQSGSPSTGTSNPTTSSSSSASASVTTSQAPTSATMSPSQSSSSGGTAASASRSGSLFSCSSSRTDVNPFVGLDEVD